MHTDDCKCTLKGINQHQPWTDALIWISSVSLICSEFWIKTEKKEKKKQVLMTSLGPRELVATSSVHQTGRGWAEGCVFMTWKNVYNKSVSSDCKLNSSTLLKMNFNDVVQ